MSFALHLNQGISLGPAIDMIRVDTLIDCASIGSDDAVDVCVGGGRGWKKADKCGDTYFELHVLSPEHRELVWIGRPYRILTIHNGWLYLCPPTHVATPEQRMMPHAHVRAVWGPDTGPRPPDCFICSSVWDIKKFGK